MPIPTPAILASDDWCHRQCFYLQRYPPLALTPREILRQAIEHGLSSEADDYAGAAKDHAMELCASTVIDTAETDLLSLAEHIAHLAEMVVWIGRTGSPWERPEPIAIGDGAQWRSGAFLSQNQAKLRHLICVDRWDALREMELRTSWQIAGECSAYQVPMDVVILVIGAMRAGRWASPFTTAWRHPVAKNLRFRKRDGNDFGAAWTKVLRERDGADRDEWLDALTEDGVLAECAHALSVDVPERETVTLSVRKLERIAAQGEVPEPQPSRCFDRMRPCAFRGCCPKGLEPSEAGFSTFPG